MKKKPLNLDLSSHAAAIREIAEQTRKLAQPVDLNELERKGILTKVGAWYEVHRFNEIPEPAQARISELKQDRNGKVKVKFKKASDFDRFAKKFAKLGL